ncbi:MAG: hypothetical protein EPN97_03145 [Alphaproteobacteria bacterium]|nr:MAG: hypothetical protein EPN97_03145 [Alphaproteobacteria bacterium]
MIYRIFTCVALLALAGCETVQLPAAQPASSQAPKPVCDKLDNMLHKLSKDASYAYTADAIDKREGVHMWFVNPKTHMWKQIRVYNNLRACVENEGSDWHWAINR